MEKTENKRSRWITFVLYPDNVYHCAYLDYIKSHEVGFYIEHIDNDEHDSMSFVGVNAEDTHETKRHWHVAVRFPNARTASGFINSLPTVDYVVVGKHVKEIDTYRVGENITKVVKKIDGVTETRYEKTYLGEYLGTETVETPMLSSNLSAFTLYQGEKVTQRMISSAQAVSDIHALAHYFIHDTFQCYMLGKHQYSVDDVKMLANDRCVYNQCFENEFPCNVSFLEQMVEIAKISKEPDVFLSNVLASGDTRLIKYLEGHAQLINAFVLGAFKRNENNTRE